MAPLPEKSSVSQDVRMDADEASEPVKKKRATPASEDIEVEENDAELAESEPVKKKRKTEESATKKKSAEVLKKSAEVPKKSAEVPSISPASKKKSAEVPSISPASKKKSAEVPSISPASKKKSAEVPSISPAPEKEHKKKTPATKSTKEQDASPSGGEPDDSSTEVANYVKPRRPKQHINPVWYFTSPNIPSNTPTAFQVTFKRALYHVISVGNLLHALQAEPDGKWIETATRPNGSTDIEKSHEKQRAVKKLLWTDARTKDITDRKLLRYLELALDTWADGDKFMPFRMHAPSMVLISTLMPKHEPFNKGDVEAYVKKQALSLFRLAVLRVFGVGEPHLIPTLATVTTLTQAITLVESSFPAEKKSLARSVYGQLQILRAKIPDIVAGCEKVALELAEKGQARKKLMSFERTYNILVYHKVPYMQKGGILPWLFVCDLAALGYCREATWEDLGRKMGLVEAVVGDEDVDEGEDKDEGENKPKPKPKATVTVKGKGKVIRKDVAEDEDVDKENAKEDDKEDDKENDNDESNSKSKSKSKAKSTATGEYEYQGVDKGTQTDFSTATKTATKTPEQPKAPKIVGGGSGPGKGLLLIKDMAKLEASYTPIEMESKDFFIRECKIVVKALNKEFKDDFEALGIAEQGILPRDMEHFLCKISRMEGRGNFEFSK